MDKDRSDYRRSLMTFLAALISELGSMGVNARHPNGTINGVFDRQLGKSAKNRVLVSSKLSCPRESGQVLDQITVRNSLPCPHS